MLKKTLFINGVEKRVVVDPEVTLARVLRNQLFLTGTKVSGGKGESGVSTVILDGKAVRSCTVKMKDVPGDAKITTIEGIGTKESLHPLQLAWLVHEDLKCGFCAPGFIVSAKALLDQKADPTKEEVKEWFKANKNVCNCKDGEPQAEFVTDAAKILRGEASKEELWTKVKDQESISDAVAMVTASIRVCCRPGNKACRRYSACRHGARSGCKREYPVDRYRGSSEDARSGKGTDL